MSVFDAVRDISARDAAERAGLAIQPKGARSWARCPASGERTASLCLYPDGGWYCFSCSAGGDSVALYAHIFALSSLDAARRLAEDFNIQTEGKLSGPPKPTVGHLRRALKAWKAKRLEELKEGQYIAEAMIRGRAAALGEHAWENERFIRGMALRLWYGKEIDALESASIDELAELAASGGTNGLK